MFGMMTDTGPKFYTVPSPLPYMIFGQGHRLRTFMLNFCVKVFRTSLFPNPLMDLVYIYTFCKVLTDHPKNCDNLFVAEYFGMTFETLNDDTI